MWITRHGRVGLLAALAAALLTARLEAAELQDRTVRAFESYVEAVEARRDAPFLWLDSLPPSDRETSMRAVRGGELLIRRLRARNRGRGIEVPDGLVHHWVGTVFVPGARVASALRLLQDYDRHATVYAPSVARSRLLARENSEFKFALRFVMAKGITVVLNSEHHARFAAAGPHRARSWIHSTRINEVENAGTANEHELPEGQGGGYLWRLNSYWRLEERDGGVYVECESISLTRGIPYGLGWLIGPFITSIPEESLQFTLENTRRALTAE